MSIAHDIEEARALFERAESVNDPEHKAHALQEALDLLDSFAAEARSTDERTLVHNLRLSHTRRLLVQLVSLTSMEFETWFNYIKLLFFELKSEVEILTNEDPELRENYDRFVRLWRQELIDAIGEE
ncbi:MAG: hypothetical protein WDZ63_04490 [Burkholderiales bacterium]